MSDERKPGGARVAAAILLMCGVVGLAVHNGFEGFANRGSRWHFGTDELALLMTAATLVIASAGLAAGGWWGRWMGLAAGVTGTLLGICMVTVALNGQAVPAELKVIGLVGPALLVCLSGRRMFDRFDGRAGKPNDGRARLVRWAVITNGASLAALMLLSYAMLELGVMGSRSLSSRLALLSTVLVLSGVLLLARGKTAGLFVGAVAVLAQVLLAVSLEHRAAYTMLLLLLPGLTFAAAVLVAYAGPLWRFARGRG
jgi:hypothetical protein